jgi:hypothetical protein
MTWQIWLDDPFGNRLALLDGLLSLSVSRVANDIGSWQVALPGDFDKRLIRLDGMVEFWRAAEGGTLRLVRVGFIRKLNSAGDADGNNILVISGPDGVELLNRRISAYAAGTAYVDKSDQADDLIKAIVRENLGSLAVTAARDLSGMNFTVAPDWSLGPTVEKKFSWKNVLGTIKDVADASREAGTELYFDVEPVVISETQIGFELRTYTGQIGMDRTGSAYFGVEWGNLASPKLEQDFETEVNYVYAGGQGEETDRLIVQVSDSARIGASPWNRREAFADARNEDTVNGVTAKGNEVLEAGRPRMRFSGTLLDTEQTRYGIDWDFGDRVTAMYQGLQFDGMIRAVRLELSVDGEETVDCKVEAVL